MGYLAKYPIDPKHPKLRGLTEEELKEKEKAAGVGAQKIARRPTLYADQITRDDQGYYVPENYPWKEFTKGLPPRKRGQGAGRRKPKTPYNLRILGAAKKGAAKGGAKKK